MRHISGLLLIVTLAACDQRSSAPPAPTTKISVRSAGQDRMHQLDDLNRAIALKRAIYASGNECRRVTKSGFVGEYKNMSYWTAACEDKFKRSREWALFIGADETVQIRLCADVAKVGLPACVIKDGAKAGTPAG
ncbi:hypothetical protein [Sphingomonas sp.]|uniref:hypothetical protein n=1 Tax=Sphingomonas sp. TaxID=28214 RepID=UPI00286D2E11|nr:hypothetical protein [Sphingomonas sp.]